MLAPTNRKKITDVFNKVKNKKTDNNLQQWQNVPPTQPPGPKNKKIGQRIAEGYNATMGRKISTVSKNISGQEVVGKRIDVKRPGFFKAEVNKSKEIYNMPKGGKQIQKEKYNVAGQVTSRKIKDINVNPSSSKLKSQERLKNKLEKKISKNKSF